MQHTKTCNFNIIETSDPFSPEPLNENTRAVEAQLASVRGEFAAADAGLSAQLAAKAPQTALAAETAARQSALTALAGRVEALERGQLIWKFDSYTGTGGTGKTHPNRLEFGFKPMLLIVFHPFSEAYGCIPWMRGMGYARTYTSTSAARMVTLTWEDRAVQWYYNVTAGPAEYQLNDSGTVYPYLVLGVAE